MLYLLIFPKLASVLATAINANLKQIELQDSVQSKRWQLLSITSLDMIRHSSGLNLIYPVSY